MGRWTAFMFWLFAGLFVLLSDGYISKLEYGLCWVCLLVNLANDAIEKMLKGD